MQSRLFLFMISAICTLLATTAFAEEVGTGSDRPAGGQTATIDGAVQSINPSAIDTETAKPRIRGGGNVEWRRSDHPAPNPGQGASGRSNGGSSDDGGGESSGGDGSESN